MKCAFCNGELKPKTWSEIEIDVCADCGGNWFDRDELGMCKARSPQTEVTLHETDIRLRCPRCETETLMEGRACGLKAHVCKECSGVALDANWNPRIQDSDKRLNFQQPGWVSVLDAINLLADLARFG